MELGGREASLTRWICSWKRRTRSKLDRLQMEYTSRNPSPSLFGIRLSYQGIANLIH